MNNDLKQRLSKFFLKLIIWLASIFIAFSIGFIFFCISLEYEDYKYRLAYPIPSGEDDLGYGIYMIGTAALMFILSVILILPLILVFKKIFSRLFRRYL
ncbi:MAG: hypothetical protein PHC99_05750 [Methylococcales bacterium]|nr:hypothetical protein [Methylococcales bacterium]